MTNVLRTQMVAAAVQRAHDGKLPINIKNVSLFLPGPGAFTAELKAQPAFELDLDDLSPYPAARTSNRRCLPKCWNGSRMP